jgi:hypothetical protein
MTGLKVLGVLVALAAASPIAAQSKSSDTEGVRRAVLDYVEGFYEGDSAKLVRALRPELFKYGFWRDSASRYGGSQMTYAQALAFAGRVKARGSQQPATAPKVVEVFEVQDQTAAAKLTAYWGTDYVLLAKYDGRWMISHVLWQGPLAAR